MYADGTVVWEFEYPEIDTADEEPGLTVMGGPGAKQVLEEIRSEVRICERPVITGENLFYVLSECTRHITYVVKAALHTGTVLWTSRIDGYSGDFNIVDASRRGLLIQQDRWLWAFAPDGTSVDKWECDVDGTSCSEFAPGRSGRYVMLSDLGLHAVDLDPYQSPIKRSAGRRPRRRSVFLSHASEDNEALVRPFYEECERRGISAWFDAAEIRWGDSIAAGVEQGLATARFVVLFVSRAFLSKPWPEKELSTALALEVAGRGVVLPILLGVTQAEIADRHPLLAEKLYRTLGDYDPSVPVSEGEIRKLVDALQERIR
jgi:hypothetical protein